MLKSLVGHVSPETAYVQPDYPYGRRLRCKRRVWIETKEGHGQRVVTQTTNPKMSFEYWNTPKAGIYFDLVAVAIDEDPASPTFEHVIVAVYRRWDGLAKLDAFLALHGTSVDPERATFYRALAERDATRSAALAEPTS